MAGSSNDMTDEMDTLRMFFNDLSFSIPMACDLLSKTLAAINDGVTGDELRTKLSTEIPCEAFVLQEIMSTEKFYDRFRAFLNLNGIATPSTRTKSDMLVLRILVALYDDESADRMFAVFRDNRKAMKQTDVTDPALYGNDNEEDPVSRPTSPTPSGNNGNPSNDPLSTNNFSTVNELTPHQMRQIISILLSEQAKKDVNEPHVTKIKPTWKTTCHGQQLDDHDGVKKDDNTTHDTKFRLETALGRIQTY